MQSFSLFEQTENDKINNEITTKTKLYTACPLRFSPLMFYSSSVASPKYFYSCPTFHCYFFAQVDAVAESVYIYTYNIQ